MRRSNIRLAIAELNESHAKLGVKWTLDWCPVTESWEFFNFARYTSLGGVKGNGAIALREVCELADRFDITITLWCVVPKLFPYYERFGFERTGSTGEVQYFDRAPIRKAEAA